MKNIKIFALLFAIPFFITPLKGQEKCGFIDRQQNESTEQFEEWLNKKISKNKKNTHNTLLQSRTEGVIITIPVVVHVVHNGEPIGTGLNIPDAQIISQIDVLNEDFRRTNADKINTPTVFAPVAADIEVEFVLAKQTPNGLPTNGIVRLQGTKDTWLITDVNDENELKAHSYWPAEDYLNIWVTQLSAGIIGYSSYPVSDLLGLEGTINDRLIDGVVVDFEAFGSVMKYPLAVLKSKYNLGRTTSHEIGHFLGLRHIWGDGNCSIDDYCLDTPLASTNNNGLNNCTFPGPNSCDEGVGDLPDMFQNFMDYTDDVCMNLFTLDQKNRMQIVLANSPRRLSLTTSIGGTAPVVANIDIGINTIISPSPVLGVEKHALTFEVINYGLDTIHSFDYSVLHNNGVNQLFSITGLSLSTGQTHTIDFGDLSGNIGVNTVFIELFNPNNAFDLENSNNTRTYYYTVDTSNNTIPMQEFFDDEITFIKNSQHPNEVVWSPFLIDNNTTMMINGSKHIYKDEEEWIVTPALDLSEYKEASVYFDLSYALSTSGVSDLFKILISTDNGLTYAPTLYSKNDQALATTSEIKDAWLPTQSSEWRAEYLDLTNYTENNEVRVAFVFKNQNGNALYIDNVEFYVEATPDTLSRNDFVEFGPNPIKPNIEALNIYFELEEKQSVAIAIYSQMGQLLIRENLSNVLNQHYQLPLGDLPAGMLIIRVIGDRFQHSERIVVIK